MKKSYWVCCFITIVLNIDSRFTGEAFQPEFGEPLINITVPVGRDATFRCLVHNLGGYRVGWVKADTKAIQAIHVHVITYNPRVGVSHNGQTTWNLHIKNVQEEDSGQYMCQINTDPMMSQMAYLNVVIPPDFIVEETSSDIIVSEGSTAKLTCRVQGSPLPKVQWRREDGTHITYRDRNDARIRVPTYESEELIIEKISRNEMGAYLCIASNGIPPAVSKRITVKVQFPPVIHVPNQLVGAPLATDVILECNVESSPTSINYWVRDSNEMVISSKKYEVINTPVSQFATRMLLTVKKLSKQDLGGYRCVAKNSLGEVDSNIRLYEIPGSTKAKVNVYNEHALLSTLDTGSADNSSDDEDQHEEKINKTNQSHKEHLDNNHLDKTNKINEISEKFGSVNLSNCSNSLYYECFYILFVLTITKVIIS